MSACRASNVRLMTARASTTAAIVRPRSGLSSRRARREHSPQEPGVLSERVEKTAQQGLASPIK
jgi:hypothetical protein